MMKIPSSAQFVQNHTVIHIEIMIPIFGQPRVLMVHSQPLSRHEEPMMKDMENIATQLDLIHKDVVEPFRVKYVPKPHEVQYTGRILEMLRCQGLDERFRCDKFNYTFSQNSIAIGLADGHPSRRYNMLVACLLLYMDYHPDNLSAIAKVSPESYYVMAMTYINMQRLGTPHTELPVEELFPGVTIMSNLLPAVLDEQVVPWEQEDKPLPMISAKSKAQGRPQSSAPQPSVMATTQFYMGDKCTFSPYPATTPGKGHIEGTNYSIRRTLQEP